MRFYLCQIYNAVVRNATNDLIAQTYYMFTQGWMFVAPWSFPCTLPISYHLVSLLGSFCRAKSELEELASWLNMSRWRPLRWNICFFRSECLILCWERIPFKRQCKWVNRQYSPSSNDSCTYCWWTRFFHEMQIFVNVQVIWHSC